MGLQVPFAVVRKGITVFVFELFMASSIVMLNTYENSNEYRFYWWTFVWAEKVTSVVTDVSTKTVLVTSPLSSDEVLAILMKTGKAVEFVGEKQ